MSTTVLIRIGVLFKSLPLSHVRDFCKFVLDLSVISNLIYQYSYCILPVPQGGPLLDASGYLIGMNTAIYSTSGANAGK